MCASRTLDTWAMRRAMKAEPELEHDGGRPKTRDECVGGHRPCPYVGCRYNLYLDIMPSGHLKLNFPALEPEDMVQSCALDIADDGPVELRVAGAAMNLSRERIRQLEVIAMRKVLHRRNKVLP